MDKTRVRKSGYTEVQAEGVEKQTGRADQRRATRQIEELIADKGAPGVIRT